MQANETRTLSQASLQDYVDCPRRFELRYRDRLSYPAIESEPFLENERRLREGQLLHQLIHQFWLGVPAGRLQEQASSSRLLRWLDNFVHREWLAGAGARFPEFVLGAPLGSFRLLAKFDLVAAMPGGRLAIFDWKTYGRIPPRSWLADRLQTRVYRALMVIAGHQLNGGRPPLPEQIELIYWFADYPDEPVHLPYDADQFKLDWELLLRLAREIESAKQFHLTEDRLKCRLCPYRSHCDRGERPGEETQLDENEPVNALFDMQFDEISELGP